MIYIEDSIKLLREMVGIPSFSFEEKKVSDHLASALERWGLFPVLFGKNIVAANRFFNPELRTLVLDAHIDTVGPAEGYSRDPYDPGDDPDIVYGLGSNDDGGSVVSMIDAFRHPQHLLN